MANDFSKDTFRCAPQANPKQAVDNEIEFFIGRKFGDDVALCLAISVGSSPDNLVSFFLFRWCQHGHALPGFFERCRRDPSISAIVAGSGEHENMCATFFLRDFVGKGRYCRACEQH